MDRPEKVISVISSKCPDGFGEFVEAKRPDNYVENTPTTKAPKPLEVPAEYIVEHIISDYESSDVKFEYIEESAASEEVDGYVREINKYQNFKAKIIEAVRQDIKSIVSESQEVHVDKFEKFSELIEQLDTRLLSVTYDKADLLSAIEDAKELKESVSEAEAGLSARLERSVSGLIENFKAEQEELKDVFAQKTEVEELNKNIETQKEEGAAKSESKIVHMERQISQLKQTINEMSSHISNLGRGLGGYSGTSSGGGEVNLKYLDDIDLTTLGDQKVLAWSSAANKFIFINMSTGGGGGGDEQVDKEFTYNADGKLATTTVYTDETKNFVAGTKTFTYNADGKLTGITGTGIFKDATIVYDSDGRVIEVDVN